MKNNSEGHEFLSMHIMAPMIGEEDIRLLLREAIKKEGSQKALAFRIGISTQYLGDILHGNRGVGGEKIMVYLKLKAVTYYVSEGGWQK